MWYIVEREHLVGVPSSLKTAYTFTDSTTKPWKNIVTDTEMESYEMRAYFKVWLKQDLLRLTNTISVQQNWTAQ